MAMMCQMISSARDGQVMTAKGVEFGVNRPITISLPDCYFDVMSLMAQLEGKEIELATERL